MWLRVTFLSLLLCILLNSVHSQNWTHHIILDDNSKYHLYWKTDGSNITFRTEVKAKGYVGLGFSPNGGMPGSDIATGWVIDKKVYFQDRHAVAFSLPLLDDQQDYELILGYENETCTVLEFTRKYETCDENDWKIDESTVRVIFAFSDRDPTGDDPFYHRENRGSKSVLLLQTNIKEDPELNLTSMLKWDVMSSNVNFSTVDTLYWCTIFKAPEVAKKHHIVRIDTVFQEGHRKYIHHFAFYECLGGPATTYEPYLNDGGQECYTPEMPVEMLKCQGIYAVWGVGGHDLVFPEHTGLPIDPGLPKYYMLEAHYDNPQHVATKPDNSGLRFYYTEVLRENDIGMYVVGAAILARLFIPPCEDEYFVVGHGNPECAPKLFPESGANALGIFLHAHLIAVGLTVRHYNGSVELTPLFDDKYYDFNYQAYRFFPKEIKVHRTDQITVECKYRSSKRTEVTLGGASTRDEMCEMALLYYPRVNQSVAYSVPTFDNINKVLKLNVTNDEELGNALRSYDWGSVDIKEVQNVTRYGEHETQCYYQGPFQDDEQYLLISYPNDLIPYIPNSTCDITEQSTNSTEESTESTEPSTESTRQITQSTEQSSASTTSTRKWTTPNIRVKPPTRPTLPTWKDESP